MKKIMSMILSLTIVLGLITPVQATETLVINNENEETIHLEDIVDSENIELEENEDETSELINKDTEVNLEGIDKTVDDEKAHSEESTDTEVEDKELDTPSYTIDGDMENYLEEYLNSLNKEESNADLEIDSEMEEYLNSLIIDEQLSEEDLEDGMYTADFAANKTGTSDSSSMAKYIDTEKSRIKIKNGKITVQLVINDSNMVVSTSASVNGASVDTKRIDIDDTSYIAEFKLGSIKDEINITVDCNYAAIIPSMGIKQHDFDLLISDVTYLEELPEEEEEENFEDGIYSVDYSVYKEGTSTDGTFVESTLKKYIIDSTLKVEDGKKKLVLNIDNSTGMIGNLTASVNGSEAEVNTTEKDKVITMEFEIGSIEDEINLGMTVTISETMKMTHVVDFVINTVEFKEELPEIEEELQDGMYTADFAANKTGTSDSSSMAKYIDTEKSRIKIKNGKITVQLVINDSNMVVKTSASVNGVSVDTKRTDIDDTSYIAEFKLGSIKDEINITVDCNYAAIVPSMGIKQHDFDLAISNITYFEDLDDKDEDIENPDDGSGETYPEEENKTLSDGTYTIESTFLKDNSTSTSAAGNYLNSKSTLTVENGNYTLTLNISQYADAFSDLSATVDGVTTKDINFVKNPDGTGTISFSINSLSSSISVGCTLTIKEINYVNTTSFDVKLDTSTIKDENGNDVEAPEEEILNVKKDAIYSINNKVVAGSNGTIPESARYLDTSSSVEVKYENIFATLVFNMADFMDKRTITLNENTSATPYSVKTQDNKTYVSFMITSLSDKIHISGKSTKDTDDSFTVVFDSATLVEIKDTGNSGSDSGSSSDSDDDDDDLDSGTYTIKNKVLKEDSDSESHAREYVDKESVVTVKNNKIYLTLKFKNASVIKGVSIKVEGDKTSYSTVKKTSDKLYIKFRIGSLSDEILVTTNLDLSDFGIENHDGLAFRVLLRSSTLEEDDDADNYDDEEDDEDEDDEDETATDTSINDNGTIKDPQNDIVNAPPVNTNSQYKKTTYRVNNEIITESSFGYQAARGAVNKVSYYEIIDDKKYITLGFSQTDIMNNIRLSINGKQINYDVVSKDDSKKTLDIRFEVPSISTQVTVTTNVTAMGRDISFGVEFLESTLELISTEEAESLPELAGNSSGVSESNSSGSVLSKITNAFSSNKTNSEDKLVVEEEAAKDLASLAKEYFKKYTVTNEIVSDSAIGRTMARKYLNQTSIIEDIDGQLYATITFSSSGSMGNFKIEVNGEVVEHTVPLNDMANELISLRFPINNVNDDIKAYIYINPMRMNINFGIKFLEDSMILIEEGTVGEEGNIESSSLADTLSQVNESSKDSKEQTSAVKIAASTSVMVIVLNQVISGLGVLLKRIKAKSLLRKIAEKQ
ncbi:MULTISPECIES: NEAT domain-containing protein [Clostridium]|uniref:NEAT domain-containing protein n=1 Tax=Clostridium TaxID=1485 RepID=UPI0002CCD111|nr:MULTISPECIES: NEAT domain-containing protein [Clostridium]ALS18249.1 cell wall anchor protein [Clostridium butyricum]AOR95321.1 cell wall anchor protein [Clostridium butyricum]AXB83606.1 cell wall anchor protein [Clostridium butyricum]EMU56040.1 putative cell wall anchor domain protein [Clostridium butyricum DKU-01]KIU06476.1 cell wall anchor domain protein [Clostridium butyricum]